MKLLIGIMCIAAVVMTTQAVSLDIIRLYSCVDSCGYRTILKTKYCKDTDLYWTDCFHKCTGFEGVQGGPALYSCNTLCDMHHLLKKYKR